MTTTTRASTARAVAAPIAFIATTAALLAGLVALGDGALAAPPLAIDELHDWATTGDPTLHAAALVRLVVIASGSWTLLTAVLGLGLRLAGLGHAVAVADRCTPAIVRRSLARVGSATLVGALSLTGPIGMASATTTTDALATTSTTAPPAAPEPAPPTSTAPDDPPTAIMSWEPTGEITPEAAPATAPSPPLSPAPAALAVPMQAPDDAPTPTTPPTTSVAAAPESAATDALDPPSAASPDDIATTIPPLPAQPTAASAAPPTTTTNIGSAIAHAEGQAAEESAVAGASAGPAAPTPAASGAHTMTVRPGQHLWGIAADVLSSRSGASVSPPEVVTYWLALIDANADRLVEPGNPDLIVPGQVLVLP